MNNIDNNSSITLYPQRLMNKAEIIWILMTIKKSLLFFKVTWTICCTFNNKNSLLLSNYKQSIIN